MFSSRNITASLVVLLMVLTTDYVVSAAESAQDQVDPAISIDYTDWDSVLRALVLDTGRSDRRPAPRPRPAGIGSKIIKGSRSITRFEANRFFYHELRGENIELLKSIRQSLEQVPGEIPFEKLESDERLAYWLNLRTIAMVEAVGSRYPAAKLRRIVPKLKEEKRLNVAGKEMSINDIEAHIMAEWDSPAVIYGFYNGTIGGPNIRKRAYTRENVWSSLRDNAQEYVSSLRGLRFHRTRAKVAKFYNEYKQLFPNFKDDLKTHILKYTPQSLSAELENASSFRVSITDWNIADLFGGSKNSFNATSQTAPVQLLDASGPNELSGIGNFFFESATASASTAGYPPYARELINRLRRKFAKQRQRDGTVIITPEGN